MPGLHSSPQGASHRPMAICLIHNNRIVDEDYSTLLSHSGRDSDSPFRTLTVLHEEEP